MHMRESLRPESLGTMLNTAPVCDWELNLIDGSLNASISSLMPTSFTTSGKILAERYHLPDCASNLPFGFESINIAAPSSELVALPCCNPIAVSLSIMNKRASSS